MSDRPWEKLAEDTAEKRWEAQQRQEDLVPGSTTPGIGAPLATVDGGGKTADQRRLRALALGPTLALLVDTLGRQIIADGVTRTADQQGDLAALWAPWEHAGMPTRQTGLWKAALTDGEAFVLVAPNGAEAKLEAASVARVGVDWGDDPTADWPVRAVFLTKGGRPTLYVTGQDLIRIDRNGSPYEVVHHGLGYAPVARFAPYLSIDGDAESLVDRLRIPARRYIKTVHDRLLIQHSNSWRVKTVTGLDDPGSIEDAERMKAHLSNSSILTGGDGVQFGSLPETSMQSVLDAERADLGTLAALASVPSWSLSGSQLVNLSADALAEAKSAERAHITAIQRALGRPLLNVLRASAQLERRLSDANDYTLRVDWRDTEARSLSQAADALGKLSQSLGVPAQLLWQRIPGVSPAEAQEWQEYANAHPSELEAYARALTADGEGTPPPIEDA